MKMKTERTFLGRAAISIMAAGILAILAVPPASAKKEGKGRIFGDTFLLSSLCGSSMSEGVIHSIGNKSAIIDDAAFRVSRNVKAYDRRDRKISLSSIKKGNHVKFAINGNNEICAIMKTGRKKAGGKNASSSGPAGAKNHKAFFIEGEGKPRAVSKKTGGAREPGTSGDSTSVIKKIDGKYINY